MSFSPVSLPAVYVLTHKPSGHFYIGSTNNLYRRLYLHLWQLKNGVSSNKKLQAAYTSWEDYDIKHTYCKNSRVAMVEEQKLLDEFFGRDLCCNICPRADSRAGSPVTDESRAKMSAAHLDNTHSEETRIRMSISQKQRTQPQEVRLKIAQARLGVTTTNKKVKVSLDGVVFNSLSEASRELGIASTTIRNRIAGKFKGYPDWKYLEV